MNTNNPNKTDFGNLVRKLAVAASAALALIACGGAKAGSGSAAEAKAAAAEVPVVPFSADSAYACVERQVAFGPRVPNTEAHRLCGDWLVSELTRHGAAVTVQEARLKAFDGTVLDARNIIGQYNPDGKGRILLLAHWDTRPWADQDPDPAKRGKPSDGANDGASGVGVLLEIARQLGRMENPPAVDILFVDAEDWGSEGDDDSWALGARHFVENPVPEGYSPDCAVLLDMVGGVDAVFCREYFSEEAASEIADRVWAAAASLGHGGIFKNRMGGAVTDDHVQFIERGIPAIDIIEYRPGGGFNPRWHTAADNMEGISKTTLAAVGKTVAKFAGIGENRDSE